MDQEDAVRALADARQSEATVKSRAVSASWRYPALGLSLGSFVAIQAMAQARTSPWPALVLAGILALLAIAHRAQTGVSVGRPRGRAAVWMWSAAALAATACVVAAHLNDSYGLTWPYLIAGVVTFIAAIIAGRRADIAYLRSGLGQGNGE